MSSPELRTMASPVVADTPAQGGNAPDILRALSFLTDNTKRNYVMEVLKETCEHIKTPDGTETVSIDEAAKQSDATNSTNPVVPGVTKEVELPNGCVVPTELEQHTGPSSGSAHLSGKPQPATLTIKTSQHRHPYSLPEQQGQNYMGALGVPGIHSVYVETVDHPVHGSGTRAGQFATSPSLACGTNVSWTPSNFHYVYSGGNGVFTNNPHFAGDHLYQGLHGAWLSAEQLAGQRGYSVSQGGNCTANSGTKTVKKRLGMCGC